MTTSSDFAEIKNFFASYFHEDWLVEANDTAQVVSRYLAEVWNAEERRGLSNQITRFIDIYANDVALEEALFSELGCYYQPSADGISARVWLQDIASRFGAPQYRDP